MGTCFVIQPFDNNGPFDKRYDEILSPAIIETNLDPYRVDRDHGVSIVIKSIQIGIHNSELILADITENNPNVWFELGLAIESNKDVILICSPKRDSVFPFDVQHRKIIKYDTESRSDFEQLKTNIKNRIEAILEKKSNLDTFSSSKLIADTEGLAQQEILILISIAQDGPDSSIMYHRIVQDLENQGFTKIAASMAVRSLLKKKMISITGEYDNFNNSYISYILEPGGWEWLEENKHKLILKNIPNDSVSDKIDSDDGEIPF